MLVTPSPLRPLSLLQALEWASYGLPSDQLCRENAIILSRFNRFPLVIDPSGQASLQTERPTSNPLSHNRPCS